MYIILGATGHVGSAVAETLLGRGEAVTVVTRDAEKLLVTHTTLVVLRATASSHLLFSLSG